jgi:hypothetical protein
MAEKIHRLKPLVGATSPGMRQRPEPDFHKHSEFSSHQQPALCIKVH